MEAFEEYAKAPHIEVGNASGSGDGAHGGHGGDNDAVDTVRGGGRKDGRTELLVIGRQDWISTVKCSRYPSDPSYIGSVRPSQESIAGSKTPPAFGSASKCWVRVLAERLLYMARRTHVAGVSSRRLQTRTPWARTLMTSRKKPAWRSTFRPREGGRNTLPSHGSTLPKG